MPEPEGGANGRSEDLPPTVSMPAAVVDAPAPAPDAPPRITVGRVAGHPVTVTGGTLGLVALAAAWAWQSGVIGFTGKAGGGGSGDKPTPAAAAAPTLPEVREAAREIVDTHARRDSRNMLRLEGNVDRVEERTVTLERSFTAIQGQISELRATQQTMGSDARFRYERLDRKLDRILDRGR